MQMGNEKLLNQNEITNLCQEFLDEIMLALQTNYKGFTCKAKWDWSDRRTTCWGGINGISIAMRAYHYPMVSLDNPMLFHEYKSFCKRKDIGEFWYDDMMIGYYTVICHEIAHAICAYRSCFKEGHGDKWKAEYASLRAIFINPFIKRSLTGDLNPRIEFNRKEEALIYLNHCHKKGLKKEWLNESYINWKNEEMRIIGLSMRALKYPVRLVRVEDGVRFKEKADVVIAKMNG